MTTTVFRACRVKFLRLAPRFAKTVLRGYIKRTSKNRSAMLALPVATVSQRANRHSTAVRSVTQENTALRGEPPLTPLATRALLARQALLLGLRIVMRVLHAIKENLACLPPLHALIVLRDTHNVPWRALSALLVSPEGIRTNMAPEFARNVYPGYFLRASTQRDAAIQ